MVALLSMVKNWQNAVLLVKPDTVLRWHREGFRLLWKRKSRSTKPRQPRISTETIALIRDMAIRNKTYVKRADMWSRPDLVAGTPGDRVVPAAPTTSSFTYVFDVHRSSSHSMMSFRLRQGQSSVGSGSGGVHRSMASRFIAMSISMYWLVVVTLTWPSQDLMTLSSTPD